MRSLISGEGTSTVPSSSRVAVPAVPSSPTIVRVSGSSTSATAKERRGPMSVRGSRISTSQPSGVVTQVPATPQALPEGSLTANIELRNLDALARLMDEATDPAERENLAALVAFLRLVGIERPDAEGGQLLTFALEANSRGEVVVNGKDLTPLLNNSASPVGGMNR